MLKSESSDRCIAKWFRFSHRSLCAAVWWISLAGWRPPSSSDWRCCGTGRPGRWAGSLCAAADSCRPGSSPETDGRSTELGAQSCSSRCFRTENKKAGQTWTRDETRQGQEGIGVRVRAYVNQSEVVLIDRELLRANFFLQSGGIGALRHKQELDWQAVKMHQTQTLSHVEPTSRAGRIAQLCLWIRI